VRYKLIAALVAVAVVTVAAVVLISPHHSEPRSERAPPRRKAEAPPDDWLLTQRLAGNSVITPGALDRATAQAARIDELTVQGAPHLGALPWEFQGPVEIGGRVLDIALDPQAADTLYVASASGGVWKSKRRREHFRVGLPANRNGGIGALAMAPSESCTPVRAKRGRAAAASPSATAGSTSPPTEGRTGTRSV